MPQITWQARDIAAVAALLLGGSGLGVSVVQTNDRYYGVDAERDKLDILEYCDNQYALLRVEIGHVEEKADANFEALKDKPPDDLLLRVSRLEDGQVKLRLFNARTHKEDLP